MLVFENPKKDIFRGHIPGLENKNYSGWTFVWLNLGGVLPTGMNFQPTITGTYVPLGNLSNYIDGKRGH